jgi:hypothetical protein
MERMARYWIEHADYRLTPGTPSTDKVAHVRIDDVTPEVVAQLIPDLYMGIRPFGARSPEAPELDFATGLIINTQLYGNESLVIGTYNEIDADQKIDLFLQERVKAFGSESLKRFHC